MLNMNLQIFAHKKGVLVLLRTVEIPIQKIGSKKS